MHQTVLRFIITWNSIILFNYSSEVNNVSDVSLTTSVLFYYTIVEFLPISDIHYNIIALITTSTHHTQVELT